MGKAIFVRGINKKTGRVAEKKFFNSKKADMYQRKMTYSGNYTGIFSYYKRKVGE